MFESVYGPQLPFSQQLHADKYRGKGEPFRDAMNRIASTLKDNKEHYHAFRDALHTMRFLPGGRIQAAVGSTKAVTAYNCFVSSEISDSMVDGPNCIMDVAKQAATVMRMGGGIGYDFSPLRPRGDMIRKLQSQCSGPISFMNIFDAVCHTIASSGHRRGAQMGVLRVDHPDIEEFIHAKQNEDQLTGFNISIGVTDEFMRAVIEGLPFELRWGGRTYKTVDAQALFESIMRSTWDWGEPGVLFIDTINRMNNLWYCENIAASNPCGEQPLPPNGACLLGSFNMTKYLYKMAGEYFFDFEQLHEDIPHVVRAMDNVVDRTSYPLQEQKLEAQNKRRMGLGVTGMANALEAMGYPYGTQGYLEMQGEILQLILEDSYVASSWLADEKGSFPFFTEKYVEGHFINQAISPHTRDMIRGMGMRNSHLTSIAPTGTISMAADNVSSGIEPVFAHEVNRIIQEFDGPRQVTIPDYGYAVLKHEGKTADQVTVDEHLAALLNAQKYIDSAVSKTLNVSPDTPWEDFKNIYFKAWQGGAKGCTTFQPNSKRMAILTKSSGGASACHLDSETGKKECD